VRACEDEFFFVRERELLAAEADKQCDGMEGFFNVHFLVS
jgi:hypothetical protein